MTRNREFLPGLSEPGSEPDITSFLPPKPPTAIIKTSRKLTERRKRRIERAFARGRRRGWGWRFVEFKKPADTA